MVIFFVFFSDCDGVCVFFGVSVCDGSCVFVFPGTSVFVGSCVFVLPGVCDCIGSCVFVFPGSFLLPSDDGIFVSSGAGDCVGVSAPDVCSGCFVGSAVGFSVTAVISSQFLTLRQMTGSSDAPSGCAYTRPAAVIFLPSFTISASVFFPVDADTIYPSMNIFASLPLSSLSQNCDTPPSVFSVTLVTVPVTFTSFPPDFS